MNFIKKYFENKNIAFFVALGVAVLSLVIGIVYASTWIKGYESVWTLVFMIVGAVAFVAASYFDARIGAALLTMCNVLGLAMFIMSAYSLIFSKAISGLKFTDPEVQYVFVFAALFLLLSVAANIFVWVRLVKRSKERRAAAYIERAQKYERMAEKNNRKASESRQKAYLLDSSMVVKTAENTESEQMQTGDTVVSRTQTADAAIMQEDEIAAVQVLTKEQVKPEVKEKPVHKPLTREERAALYATRARQYEERAEQNRVRALQLEQRAEKAKLQAEKMRSQAQKTNTVGDGDKE